jgi:hypothetical protein
MLKSQPSELRCDEANTLDQRHDMTKTSEAGKNDGHLSTQWQTASNFLKEQRTDCSTGDFDENTIVYRPSITADGF